jgi:pyruvate/2-oxoglutarate dehydrogenase complex dihydrolipoamide dehydrogenase (E3) component
MGHAAEPVVMEPMDEHNTRLVNYVHPSDWTNPEPKPKYNMVVIGGGPAGLVTAAAAAGLGAKVALVEKHFLGGDCLNVGCVPSKCVIRSARAAAELRDAARFGIEAGRVDVDFGAVMRRMREVRAGIAHVDSAERYQRELGVDVFLGAARFTGSDTVEVGGATLRFRRACIATGARAATPPIDGLAESGYLTNETVFSLTERPARLAVIGAGPIGCELAQAFQLLGSQVTVIEMAQQILGREDREAAGVLEARMRRDGVRFMLGAKTERVSVDGAEKVLHLDVNGTREEVRVDAILVGAGRKPNVEGLDLEAAGIAYDARKGVEVNDHLRTTNPRVYAAGDVSMAHKFTHAADFAARIVIQNALFSVFGLGRKRLSSLVMPWCTYTHPEVAHVGLYEHEAAERGLDTQTFVQRLDEVDRALADGEPDGFVKIHVQRGSDRILGATVVAQNAGDIVSEITLAMTHGLGLAKIGATIHPYPTQADAVRKTADAYNRTRLTPSVKRWMERWMAFRL